MNDNLYSLRTTDIGEGSRQHLSRNAENPDMIKRGWLD